MKRKEYWMYTLGMLAAMFIFGMFQPHRETIVIANAISIIYMWVVGAARMEDTKYSQGWAFFAPFLIGTIWIGCIPSKENTS